MKKVFFRSLTLFFALSLLWACNNNDDNDPDPIVISDPDIIDLAIANNDLSVLLEALVQADLVATLQGNGPYTVFAPTNDAFETFLIENNYVSVLEIPLDVLSQVLLNHVVSGENFSSGLSTGYISSLSTAGAGGNNLSLFIDTTDGVSINGVADVVNADNDATNGVVHIVDEVIGLPNIVDHATANSDLSSLVSALTDGGNTTFTDLLSDTEVDFTVFAPVNSAFDAFSNPNGNALDNILSNHVIVNTAAASTALTNSYLNTEGTNVDGDKLSIYVNTDNGVTLNGVSTVAVADIIATNGIIHAVDAVIDIPTVVSFALADPNFSTLVSALTELTPATDFAGILSRTAGGNGDGIDPDFTVFAPTNDAFAALTSIPEESVLTPILLHHVVSGANIRTEDLNKPGNTPATTLEGDDITITFPPTDPNIADITDGTQNTGGIIDVNIQAGNGVIHVLNAVLIPDTNN
ncbi:fasciclin domain-containing protein [Flavobacteriaceae bacterium D16]|nr:fasciclin domain-containing protein [Flavobacteriaceae bacterium D16]